MALDPVPDGGPAETSVLDPARAVRSTAHPAAVDRAAVDRAVAGTAAVEAVATNAVECSSLPARSRPRLNSQLETLAAVV